tara:strand:+ start:460 stop:720 length:261 start_codon:yes stop_codon:yes gene_type:complete
MTGLAPLLGVNNKNFNSPLHYITVICLKPILFEVLGKTLIGKNFADESANKISEMEIAPSTHKSKNKGRSPVIFVMKIRREVSKGR